MVRLTLPGLVFAAALVGCDGRALSVPEGDGGPDLAAFCIGPPKVAFDGTAPLHAESASAHLTIVSGPASPHGGSVGTVSRVWVRLVKASTWDWVNESGVTVNEHLSLPVQVDLARLPPQWLAWSEHGLRRTLPAEDRPFSSRQGHRFEGWLAVSGSTYQGAHVTLCLAATRPDGSTIQVHAANIPPRGAP